MAGWKKINEAKAEKKMTKKVKASQKNRGDATTEGVPAQEQGTSNTMGVSWTCDKPQAQIDHFDFWWQYYTAANGWVNGGTSTVPPNQVGGWYQTSFTCSNTSALVVRYQVRPVAKNHNVTVYYYEKVRKKKVQRSKTQSLPFWTCDWGGWSSEQKAPAAVAAEAHKVAAPAATGTPTVNLQSNGLPLVRWTNVPDNATSVYVRRYSDGNWGSYVDAAKDLPKSSLELVDTGATSGHQYRYATICYNSNGEKWGAVSALSDTVDMPPNAPTSLAADAMTSTSAMLTWKDSDYTGDRYEIYTCSSRAEALDPVSFGVSPTTYASTPVAGANHYTVTELEGGATYWFTLCRVSDGGRSALCEPAGVTIGAVAEAPTPVTSFPCMFRGETFDMQWIHNCADGSAQTWREVVVQSSADGVTWTTVADEAGVSSLEHFGIDTSGFADGTRLRWRVRTKGAYTSYTAAEVSSWKWSQWSEMRVWVKPTMTVVARSGAADGPEASSGTPLSKLPLFLNIATGVEATSQRVVEWHVSVESAESFMFVNEIGENDWMESGTLMYSAYFDATDDGFGDTVMDVAVSAADAVFSPGVDYLVRARAAMDSGLVTDEATCSFECHWQSSLPEPSASVMAVEDYTCVIAPACLVWDTDEYGQPVPLEDNGEPVYETDGGSYVYDSEGTASYEPGDGSVLLDAEGNPVPAYQHSLASDVDLAVWRINPDMTMDLIAEGVPNSGKAIVTDPYPNFGTCWYRIIANDLGTDEVRAIDVPVDMDYDMLLFQWRGRVVAYVDEDSGNVRYEGQSVELPFNIETSESYEKDVAELEFPGRRFPVTYYGTQVRHTLSWKSVKIRYDEIEDIDAVRELAEHMGDVHVRDPWGNSFWANVNVSGLDFAANSPFASVAFSIRRVDHLEPIGGGNA